MNNFQRYDLHCRMKLNAAVLTFAPRRPFLRSSQSRGVDRTSPATSAQRVQRGRARARGLASAAFLVKMQLFRRAVGRRCVRAVSAAKMICGPPMRAAPRRRAIEPCPRSIKGSRVGDRSAYTGHLCCVEVIVRNARGGGGGKGCRRWRGR